MYEHLLCLARKCTHYPLYHINTTRRPLRAQILHSRSRNMTRTSSDAFPIAACSAPTWYYCEGCVIHKCPVILVVIVPSCLSCATAG